MLILSRVYLIVFKLKININCCLMVQIMILCQQVRTDIDTRTISVLHDVLLTIFV